jgi:thiol:disulfide interchange protein
MKNYAGFILKRFGPPLAVLAAISCGTALAQGARHIYSETANAHYDIASALKKARAEHKRVILDFGGNWCGDCQVLDIYLHQQPNLALLEKNFVLVNINISSQYDTNLDIIDKYEIPIHNGVPLLMVLNAQGTVLYMQKHKEFEKMQAVTPESVTEFLNQWKPRG